MEVSARFPDFCWVYNPGKIVRLNRAVTQSIRLPIVGWDLDSNSLLTYDQITMMGAKTNTPVISPGYYFLEIVSSLYICRTATCSAPKALSSYSVHQSSTSFTNQMLLWPAEHQDVREGDCASRPAAEARRYIEWIVCRRTPNRWL